VKDRRPWLRTLALLLGWGLLFGATLWASGAIYFDLPIAWLRTPLALVYGAAILALLILVKRRGLALAVSATAFFLVLIWWLSIKPSNDRAWQPDVAQTAWAEIDGDLITLHNVRNCDYRTATDYTPHWETRTVRLSQITGMDLAINYWGSPWMAHPIVSFQFADAPPLCVSVETRKEMGESYSAIGGIYRQFELIYIVADERDVLRVRTNYRHGEDVYLYRTMASPAQARERFLEYVNALNGLRTRPRWYNAITTNCTTSVRAQRPTNERMPWDWRILLNGKGDQLLYERRLIATGGLPFAELKRRSRINERAHVADKDPGFSRLVRQGIPGFGSE
jgi:hypothetical protein